MPPLEMELRPPAPVPSERLRTKLRSGETVSRATFDAGYSSGSRVYESAGAMLGMTPATYRKGGAGMHIGFIVTRTPLGRLLVAGTERGVCMVSLGDDGAALEAALRREYPRATIESGTKNIRKWVDEIVRHLQGTGRELSTPVDVQATAFQWRVWQALRDIPFGETRSYREVAAAIGRPAAVRAVARACASNRVALVVPCHRVVRSDGDLGGYRWGIERKRKLLEREGRS